MLKLTKYELRKNLLGIGIVAGIICVLQALFMFFCLTENINYTSLFGGLLIIAASVSYFIVFIFGVVTYYRELSSKSSYLIKPSGYHIPVINGSCMHIRKCRAS